MKFKLEKKFKLKTFFRKKIHHNTSKKLKIMKNQVLHIKVLYLEGKFLDPNVQLKENLHVITRDSDMWGGNLLKIFLISGSGITSEVMLCSGKLQALGSISVWILP